jgi:hypothetical protein
VSELINRWFSRTGRVPGMLACGLRYHDGSTFSRTWEVQISESLLNELWTRLHPISEVAGVESAEMMRWTFDKNAVVAAARENGPTFFVLLAKKSGEAEDPGLERLLHEFRALRG